MGNVKSAMGNGKHIGNRQSALVIWQSAKDASAIGNGLIGNLAIGNGPDRQSRN